ncbi:type II secretion system F family protein [Pseudomonas sp. K1(2024)]|uniref:Type II secretion system F family protein n=1 Tax=Pseudomonas boreofloridensis TaxID=3064348 RepID=A0ABV4ZFR9_9PSED|nr:type II secretion system F family protein [Pseudomonas sp. K13]MDO7904277.1 type II secretion system F family protein [Pseudomonas sp. K13]
MIGPLLLTLAPALLGAAVLLLRQVRYKRGEERALRRLGRAWQAQSGATRRDWLEPMLQRAGLGAAEWPVRRILLLWLGLVLLAALMIGWQVALLLLLGLPLAGYLYLGWRARRRMRQLIEQLPGLLDASVRSLKAGRTLSDAVLGGIEGTREPLHSTLSKVRRSVQLGVPLDDALSELAELYDQDELRLFALGLRINQRHGGNASELMENLIRMIREREQGIRQLKAMTGETRVTAWVLGALPLFMVGYFLVVNPAYLMQLWHDTSGQMMLLLAFALQTLGCVVLWRMMRSL